MDKNKEILFKQKRQNELKIQILKLKKKLPSLIIGAIFFVAVSLYFLEDKFYHLFGNSVNFIFSAVILLGIFSTFLLLYGYFKIKIKEKEIKEIGIQLYKLNRLELDITKNE